MVVVSGSWVKNVVAYPSPAMSSNNSLVGDMVMNMNNNNNINGSIANNGGLNNGGLNNNAPVVSNGKAMCAKAVLICRPNSHPFQERTLVLDQPVKVGRSVARARATSSNAIFDCKVLSRHHALLWYECGKFYLQDTKSSNGTFVNNNRLSSNESEPHEISSGDIVQFGVDVVENNRKVTHGCIIATLKLYLPDGKEAKASPSITEGNRHGMVPLDELYKLNQIIQEAAQREMCLETKLIALQQVVEKAKKSAEDSWQAYVGEERLLSKVSALESQLTQAGKTMSDEKLREELSKLQEDSAAYQVAAKKTLDKLHSEKLEAIALALEEQRAKETAEQEAILANEQLRHIEDDLQDIAQKLVEEQKKASDEKFRLEQRERELLARLDTEAQTISDLQDKIKILSNKPDDELLPLEQLEKYTVIYDLEMNNKEQLLGENEVSDAELNRSNGLVEPQQNHINLTVAPCSDIIRDNSDSLSNTMSLDSEQNTIDSSFMTLCNDSDTDDNDNSKDDTPERSLDTIRCAQRNMDSPTRSEPEPESPVKEKHEQEAEEYSCENVQSKTLKYQYQSVQKEMNKQIDQLQSLNVANQARILDLAVQLQEQMQINRSRSEETDALKHEFLVLQTKLKEASNEAQQYKDKVALLTEDLEKAQELVAKLNSLANGNLHGADRTDANFSVENVCQKVSVVEAGEGPTEGDRAGDNRSGDNRSGDNRSGDNRTGDTRNGDDRTGSGDKQPTFDQNLSISTSFITQEQFSALEEELVVIKEKYAQINDEKTVLNNTLSTVREEYNVLCNRNHNQMFFYIAPLVLMVLYLLISSMFS